MKVVCDREQLLRVFSLVASVTSGKVVDVLGNVKCIAKADGLALFGTNKDMWLLSEVGGCEVESSGAALLPVQRFGAILKESSDERIVIETDGTHLKVRGEGDRWSFDLPSVNPDEYPVVQEFGGESQFTADCSVFRESLRRTSFAVDVASTRFALGGVRLEFGDEFNVVATDGRRLSHVGIKGELQGDSSMAHAIIPERSCKILERALPEEGQVNIRLGERASFEFGGVLFGCLLVEGRFPSWRQVIPAVSDWTYVEIPVGPFVSAVRQAAIVADAETRGLDFAFSPGELRIGVKTAELGQSAVTMPVGGIEDDVTLRLDHRFVRDFLQCFEPAETVSLHFKSSTQPTLFESGSYRYVVMPMAIDS